MIDFIPAYFAAGFAQTLRHLLATRTMLISSLTTSIGEDSYGELAVFSTINHTP
jgi:hypothetical protein